MTQTSHSATETRTVLIPARGITLGGDLTVPPTAKGIVLFAHGSGSSRMSPRNRRVAETLQEGGYATLLFDLLTSEEDALDAVAAPLRFDIPLLALRLVSATEWVTSRPEIRDLPLAYFGASTGAAAALVAAAVRPEGVRAVVSRGGRPDLAGRHLPDVAAPTLLIVGERDEEVIALNRTALAKLGATEKELVIVPRATHLFEEPGALEQVAQIALGWLELHVPNKMPVAEDATEIC